MPFLYQQLEKDIANIVVEVVCTCGPPRHVRGFPECHKAREVARIVVENFSEKLK